VIRPVLSYILSGLILLTQAGIPLHRHYCQGILESVSVFYAQHCNDGDKAAASDSCCKREEVTCCVATEDPCCSDEVTVVSQQVAYLSVQALKWISPAILPTIHDLPIGAMGQPIAASSSDAIQADTGPPLYILHQSLIIYA
jgi:hypothetical protein